MFTSGHLRLLKDALARVSDVFPDLSAEDMRALLQGLVYPDFPCGSLIVHKDRVEEGRMKVCGLPRLLAAVLFAKLSFGYQSHNGFYSLWHAMTIDPDNTVANVAKNACEYVLVACNLAFQQRSMFWLGFALHVVMDAYSPAHVLRDGAHPSLQSDDLVTYIRMHDSELPRAAQTSVQALRSLIRTIVDGVAAGEDYSDLVRRQPKSQRMVASFILYEHLQRRKLPFRVKPDDFVPSKHAPNGHGRIMNFYYYPRQPILFHSKNDRIRAVRKAGLYNPCVADCSDLLRAYATAPTAAAFLHHIYELMTRRTFAIHASCEDAESGFEIDRLLNQKVRHVTLKLVAQRTGSRGSRGSTTVLTYTPSGLLGRAHRSSPRAEQQQKHSHVYVVQKDTGVTFYLPTCINASTQPARRYRAFRFSQVSSQSQTSRMAKSAHVSWSTLTYSYVRVRGLEGFPFEIQVKHGPLFKHPVLTKMELTTPGA